MQCLILKQIITGIFTTKLNSSFFYIVAKRGVVGSLTSRQAFLQHVSDLPKDTFLLTSYFETLEVSLIVLTYETSLLSSDKIIGIYYLKKN
jgi:hypothetical protein